MPDFSQMREIARAIFRHALADASIHKAFDRHVHCERGILRVREDLYDLQAFSNVLVVSLGKAGNTMVEALSAQVGASLEGIVASSVEPSTQVRGFRYFRGGHPTPNAESMQAAGALLRAVESQPASALIIFLLSGGGSSIVEKPIDDEISLEDLVATYRSLVLSGAPIAEINGVRKHLSAVKGGRLALAAFPAHQVSVLVSDVPDSTPDALASGPTMPDSTTVEDCYRIAEKYELLKQFPCQPGSFLNVMGSTKRRSPTTLRFTRRDGGLCCRTTQPLKKRASRRSEQGSSCTWTTPVTIGITTRLPDICCRECAN